MTGNRRGRRQIGLALQVAGALAGITGLLGLLLGWGTASDDNPDVEASATSTSTSAASTTTSTPDEDAVRQFTTNLFEALARRDEAFATDRLDPVVIAVFGADACRQHVAAIDDPGRAIAVRSVSGPADYTYAVDGISIRVPRTWTVHGRATVYGSAGDVDIHVGTASGAPTWFTDCGTPLPTEAQRLPPYARRVAP